MKMAERITDIIYPRRCPVCDDAVTRPGLYICDECADAFRPVRDPYCLKCGSPLRDDSADLCEDCKKENRKFTSGRAAFIYDDVLKESVYRYKYGNRAEYADHFAESMADILGSFIRSSGARAFIPIPLHKSRLAKRGYNQAALLADRLSERFDIPVRNDILIRSEKTRVQKSLRASQRQNNLKKAFKIDSDVVKLKNIILVDDIYTTGSTIDAAAGCLKGAGVDNVNFVVLGIADIG